MKIVYLCPNCNELRTPIETKIEINDKGIRFALRCMVCSILCDGTNGIMDRLTPLSKKMFETIAGMFAP